MLLAGRRPSRFARRQDGSVTTPIEGLLGAVCARIRGVRVERLKVKYEVDDDNVWNIRQAASGPDVQIECRPNGEPPFLIKGDGAGQRVEIDTTDEALRVIQEWLGNPN